MRDDTFGCERSSVCTKSSSTNSDLSRVRARSRSPVDYKLPAFIAGPVAGIDVSGVVESVADDVKHLFSPGDEVFGFSNGSVCELTTADASKTLAFQKS